MLAGLLHRAAVEPAVTTVRATIRPDNAASLATISGFAFVEVGEQWDEEDGRELIFEVPADDPGRDRADFAAIGMLKCHLHLAKNARVYWPASS